MLTEAALHKDPRGFSKGLWPAGQLNIFLLDTFAAVLILSNLFFLH